MFTRLFPHLREPEPILDSFKSYATRALRRTGLLNANVKPWARHGSTIYLWKERDVEKAVEYVLLGQDGELPPLDSALPDGRASAPILRVTTAPLAANIP